jgi:hypothetical protein
MAAKDFITKGIGADPGSLLYWLNGGLGTGVAEALPDVHPVWRFSFGPGGRVIETPAGGRVVKMPRGGRVIETE